MLLLLTFLTVYLNLNTVFVDDEDDEICIQINVDDAQIFKGHVAILIGNVRN